ncbi:MAG: hypothetical protein WCI53_12705 [Bacteroidota bacterium]
MTKKFLLLAFLTMLFNIENLSAQTTLQDYNYVSSGLLDDINKGKDIRAGYKLESTGISESIERDGTKRNARIYYFKKISTGKTQAFAVECTGNEGSRRFICIPTDDASSDIWKKTWEEFNGTGCEWNTVFMWSLMKLTAEKLK